MRARHRSTRASSRSRRSGRRERTSPRSDRWTSTARDPEPDRNRRSRSDSWTSCSATGWRSGWSQRCSTRRTKPSCRCTGRLNCRRPVRHRHLWTRARWRSRRSDRRKPRSSRPGWSRSTARGTGPDRNRRSRHHSSRSCSATGWRSGWSWRHSTRTSRRHCSAPEKPSCRRPTRHLHRWRPARWRSRRSGRRERTSPRSDRWTTPALAPEPDRNRRSRHDSSTSCSATGWRSGWSQRCSTRRTKPSCRCSAWRSCCRHAHRLHLWTRARWRSRRSGRRALPSLRPGWSRTPARGTGPDRNRRSRHHSSRSCSATGWRSGRSWRHSTPTSQPSCSGPGWRSCSRRSHDRRRWRPARWRSRRSDWRERTSPRSDRWTSSARAPEPDRNRRSRHDSSTSCSATGWRSGWWPRCSQPRSWRSCPGSEKPSWSRRRCCCRNGCCQPTRRRR